jgi:adenosyl cobinamide kinase/adenosyl cobinamide phosphate guanylyltransferase
MIRGTHISLVTGGARSGKSSFVMHAASEIRGHKAFIATAEALDKEMKDRIEKHRRERGPEWDTLEVPVNIAAALSDAQVKYNAIVLDCLTLWLSNILLRTQIPKLVSPTIEERMRGFLRALEQLKKSRGNAEQGTRVFIVSNEVGMGIVPENHLARKFRDLAGTLNQMVAALADEVYLVTAGIPVKIK